MVDVPIFRSAEFIAGVDEFTDAASTLATAMQSFRLLLNAGVDADKMVPHLQSAMDASARVKAVGTRLEEIMTAARDA